jgi:hypothetical protein
MNVPMREKYIDEAFKPLHVFGSSELGKVDVCNEDGVVIMLDKDIAEKVIEINQRYMNELYSLLGFKEHRDRHS